MIRFVEQKKIDKKLWDGVVTTSDTPLVYALSWMLDIANPSWGALIEDDYKRVMPVMLQSKYGISYINQPFPLQQLGVFGQNISKEVIQAFMTELTSLSKYIEINIATNNQFSPDQWHVTKAINQELEISTYEELKKMYSTNLKRSLKKAERANLKLKTGVLPDEIVTLFKETKGKTITNLTESDYSVMKQTMQEAQARNCGFSLGAYVSGELIGVVFFISNNNRLLYLKGAVTEAGRQFCAMHLMLDDTLQKNEGKRLDFGGSNIDSLHRFYKSFGAIDKPYLQLKRNKLPFPLRLLKR